jgi:serine/threonine protein kinase/DNA-directed RNA polymerase subunit RPC12/RpoP
MIVFLCSRCGKTLRINEEYAGRKGRCTYCQHPMIVPSAGSSDAKLHDFLSPPQSAGEIGRLGSYRILKAIGCGSMGIVFEAEDPKLKRVVALKALPPAPDADTSKKVRFLRGVKAAAAIEHDRLVPIYEVGEDGSVPFFTMPLLNGETLETRLQRRRKLPVDEALRIAKETAEGLAAIHERDLIHGDIKPAHLWLEGDKGRVKILDLGLAWTKDPEQGVDRRCDLFGLGCVMYGMIAGEPPYKGSDAASMRAALAAPTPTAPRKLNPDVSPRLSRLIMELLAKNPSDRPTSAAAVVDVLNELEKEPPPDAIVKVEEPPPPMQAVRAAAPSDRGTVRRRSRIEEEPEEPPVRRSLMLPLLLGGGCAVLGLVMAAVLVLIVLINRSDNAENAASNTTPSNNIPPPQPVNRPANPKPALAPQPNKARAPGNRNSAAKNSGGKAPSAANKPPKAPVKEPEPKKETVREPDRKFQHYKAAVKQLLFAPDNKHFFSFGDGSSKVDYWELETGKIAHSFDLGEDVRRFSISSDGSRVMAFNNKRLLCWEVGDGQLIVTVAAPLGMTIVGGGFTVGNGVRAALSAKIQAGSEVYIYDHAIRSLVPVLDPKTKKPAVDKRTRKVVWKTFPHPGTEAERAFFSPDGNRFLTWSRDHVFRVWNAEEPSRVTKFPAAPGDATDISVTPDFKRLMATFGEPEFRIYDVDSGKELKEIKPDGSGDTEALAYGSRSNLGVIARSGGKTRLYDLDDGTIKKEVKGIASTSSIALAPDAKSILCGDGSGTIYLFKLDE